MFAFIASLPLSSCWPPQIAHTTFIFSQWHLLTPCSQSLVSRIKGGKAVSSETNIEEGSSHLKWSFLSFISAERKREKTEGERGNEMSEKKRAIRSTVWVNLNVQCIWRRGTLLIREPTVKGLLYRETVTVKSWQPQHALNSSRAK